MTQRHELWALLDRVQMDVRALDTKIQSIRTHVAALELPDQPDPIRCPHCAATHRSRTQAEEHLYRIHNGPVPSSDLAAEHAAGLDTTILSEMLDATLITPEIHARAIEILAADPNQHEVFELPPVTRTDERGRA